MGIEVDIAGVKVGDSQKPRIMGIINFSVESFYTGSVARGMDGAVKMARQMVDDGADFLDIGAMSTNPKAPPLSEAEEMARLFPILGQVLDEVDVPVSVDTQRPEIAEKVLDMGAHMINDVSAFNFNPEIADVVADHGCPVILMATRKTMGDCLTIDKIIGALEESMRVGSKAGIQPDRFVVDPGIGMWTPEKKTPYNLDIIRDLEDLRCLGKPVLVGISRKSFIGEVLERPDPGDRLLGSLSATAIAVYNGAHIVRTHDVKETKETTEMAWALRINP